MTETITTLPGAIAVGLSCACPRCGQGRLFAGFLKLQPRGERCRLDYDFADSGDGPAMMIALQYHHQAAESRFGQLHDKMHDQDYDREHQEHEH